MSVATLRVEAGHKSSPVTHSPIVAGRPEGTGSGPTVKVTAIDGAQLGAVPALDGLLLVGPHGPHRARDDKVGRRAAHRTGPHLWSMEFGF